jgi:hypothetical protein
MTHHEFISTLTRLVRGHGAAAALAELRTTRPDITVSGYHDTLAVFAVWAVDRLVTAGLTDTRILWHPLSQLESAAAWWDLPTLASDAARDGFVPSTLARGADPRPIEPNALLAA